MQVAMEPETYAPDNSPEKTLLIVDDDDVFRMALADGITLMEDGLAVCTAENGEQARAIIKNTAVDLVITDLRMPVMDGAELALWLAENRPSLPVIVISAYIESEAARDLKAQGNHFIDKPLDLGDLMTSIRNLLHQTGPRAKTADS